MRPDNDVKNVCNVIGTSGPGILIKAPNAVSAVIIPAMLLSFKFMIFPCSVIDMLKIHLSDSPAIELLLDFALLV